MLEVISSVDDAQSLSIDCISGTSCNVSDRKSASLSEQSSSAVPLCTTLMSRKFATSKKLRSPPHVTQYFAADAFMTFRIDVFATKCRDEIGSGDGSGNDFFRTVTGIVVKQTGEDVVQVWSGRAVVAAETAVFMSAERWCIVRFRPDGSDI